MAKRERDPKTTMEKQAFVAMSVKSDPSLSMYQIGESVKERFGTMIAFDKLREAFLGAGGKLGKRGRKKGSKNRPKSGKAAAKKNTSKRQRDPSTTLAKQEYIASLVKKDASMTMFQIGQEVKAKFGTMIAFDKLREAFLGAGGKLGKRGRKKGSKNKPKTGIATRGSVRSAGRRKSDIAGYVARRAMGRLSAHLVIVTNQDGMPVPYTFENKSAASSFVQKQLDAGVSFEQIGYYHKQEMGVRVTL